MNTYNIMELNEIKNFEIFLNRDENGREIKIYSVDNITNVGLNNCYPNILFHSDELNVILNPVNEKIMSLEKLKKEKQIKFQTPKTSIVISTPVFFFIYNTDNYFHFLYDTLPYLISFFHLKKKIPNLKLLMSYPNINKKDLYGFVLDF